MYEQPRETDGSHLVATAAAAAKAGDPTSHEDEEREAFVVDFEAAEGGRANRGFGGEVASEIGGDGGEGLAEG